MMMIISGLLASGVLASWGASVVGTLLISVVSLTLLVQNFGRSFDLMATSSNVGVLLALLAVVLCFLALLATPEERSASYIWCIIALGVALVLVFMTGDVIVFYTFFEVSLIPTLMLIIGWGYQPERLQAGSYMMLYTVAASLPLLVALLYRCFTSSTTKIYMLSFSEFSSNSLVAVMVFGAFLVKLPMYGVHLWLPKAHVEAPLAGSMILAGILLKLGGYGLIQMNSCFLGSATSAMSTVFVVVSMWGGMFAVLMCLRQSDVKALVAYSSVGHMGIVIAGILVDYSWGAFSAVVTMVAHGFSSSAMFCLAYFTYKKSHTRGLSYMKGFLVAYPSLSLMWFLVCCVNMAAPFTINLMGELLVVPSLWMSQWTLVVIMGVMVFFSAAFNMYLYTTVNHGEMTSSIRGERPLESYSLLVVLSHLAPLLLVFKSSIFT
uniref:NADH dehydrogenase subunit 4 n=1 Tax=Melampus sincaporensis TaxID=1628046 RepID=UPI0030025D7A|nr:NADH dehydrogenase subunit 4 [Melampus sincaporensis]